ncbi:MAG: glycosyltransferase family 4 protein [Chloroflexota bacterium]
MKTIAILHHSAPPEMGVVEKNIYNHILLLNQAGYSLRVISGVQDEAYYESGFHHSVMLLPVREILPDFPETAAITQSLAAGEMHPDFKAAVHSLIARLMPLLSGVQVCFVYNTLTTPQNLLLTAALHTLRQRLPVRLVAWTLDDSSQPDLPLPSGSGSSAPFPWSLLCQVWPGVRYVAASRHCQERLTSQLQIAPEEIAVIPAGIDPEEFLKWEPHTHQLVHDHGLFEAAPLLLCPCIIAPGRRLEFAIQVVAALGRRYPRAAMLVFDLSHPDRPVDPDYARALRTQARDSGIPQRIHLAYARDSVDALLQFSNAVLADLYHLADLLFLPYQQDCLGIPLLRAGLVRLPIFASDTSPFAALPGGLPHAFDPNGSPEEVAQAIADSLQADPAFAVRQQVLDQFTWQAILKNQLTPLVEESTGSPDTLS